MKLVSELRARAGYGPVDFWRDWGDCIRDRRENEHRDWLTYDEYRVIFRLAHKAGLFAVYSDQNGEPTPRFHSPLGDALLRLYRGVKGARERGIPPEQFHAEFCLDVDRGTDSTRQAIEYRERKAREAREAAAQERRQSDRRRRIATDEPEIAEVRVGYQPPAERQAV